MRKRWELRDKSRIALIRKLAGDPQAVRPTNTARQDMTRLRLTMAGVCEAICDYIDGDAAVMETITDAARGYIGKPAYEVYPTIDAEDLFVKVGIDKRRWGLVLILISVHERQGRPSS